ncbi:MAG: TetR/AcrR family transcriptional regulator [Lachnospiraceae bacterium]|nr:TetR/AcrR family transcriptional regulator [Lachnospiraceae bacterium]
MPKSPERCQEIRKEMRTKILHESMLYFARNGFAGTKISDLAKSIGIGQGTLYLYFNSKEDLFNEIFAMIDSGKETQKLKLLAELPLSAKQKIHKLSKFLMDRLEKDEMFAAMITLNAQATLEKNDFAYEDSSYQSDWYQYTAQIIEQGQKEKSVVAGSPMKLADYYWGVVYLYSLKKLFTAKYETISAHDLERILLKDNEK